MLAQALVPARAGDDSTFKGEAQIVFSGKSTLHDFSGKVNAQPFELKVRRNANGRAESWSAQGEIRAAEMDTANKDRDKNMHKMFEAEIHALISGIITNAPAPSAGSSNATASLTLKIRNQIKSIPVEISEWEENEKAVNFTAKWRVSLKDFALKPPSVLGIIKVNDTVQLIATVQAKK